MGENSQPSSRWRSWAWLGGAGLFIAIGLLLARQSSVLDRLQRSLLRDETRARMDVTTIWAAIESYRIDNGRLPAHLLDLVARPAIGPAYLPSLPVDPWGNGYGYVPAGATDDGRVFSLGSDGAAGGNGDAADIVELVAR